MTHNFLILIIFFSIKSHACILLEKSDSTKRNKIKNMKASSPLHPPLPFFFSTEVQLIYNVALVLGVQQRYLYIYICI